MTTRDLDIIAVGPADDAVLIKHYLAIWNSYGTPPDVYAPDAADAVRRFIEECRADGSHGGFLAIVDGDVAGSAMACLLRSPYPEVIKPGIKRRGYIWPVYTKPAYRGRGVGKALTERAIAHLKSIGCTHVVLHASDAGAPMYEKLGFTRAGEMRITL
jgi:GNAT superfamily N-acetyltransferase